MPSLHVLVIDDEPAARQVLAAAVSNAGYSVDVAADFAEAMKKLALGDVDVALCDIKLPDGHGIDLLKQSRASGCETTFLMVTAFASVESAVEALRAGAFDYLIKPVRHVEVLHRLSQIEAVRGLHAENKALRRAIKDSKPVYRFMSDAMVKVERLVDKIAATDSTVLITGESGTGKGVAARAIHERSVRRDGPFLTVNCAAIPEQLLESEFFGHTRGAFTSAERARKGMFLEADRGTLFLDEIADLPVHMQTKLLHVIEDKQVRPLGAEQSRRVDARIIVATNGNLTALVNQGRFREDLYFRLSMFEIALPPLRERPEDLGGLIRFFLETHRRPGETPASLRLDAAAETILRRHSWPGNVRELENVINRACILVEGDTITPEELPAGLTKDFMTQSSTGKTASEGASLHDQRRVFEAEVIRRAIADADGDRKAAARSLNISISSLYSKLSGNEQHNANEP